MLKKFHGFLQKLSGRECPVPDTTLIFDKGNNSANNFALLDCLQLDYVGSVKLEEHKELARVQLDYRIDAGALHEISDTFLGKNIIITSKENWEDAKIIKAYRSQFIIEDVFKEMKDRSTGSWWPLHHWTDSKISVHGLYCTIALLLRALILRRVRQAGIGLSMKRVLAELDTIREVVNIYSRKRRHKAERKQAVLTKTSEVQQKLMSILGLKKEEYGFLG